MLDFGTDQYGRPITVPTSAASGVELVIGEIEKLTRHELPQLREQVSGQLSGSCAGFQYAPRDPDMFGMSESGFMLGARAEAAHDVFVQTVNALVADLEEYATKLRASLQTAVDADDQSEAHLRGLLRVLDSGTSIDAAQRSATAQYAAVLGVQSPAGEPAPAQQYAPVDASTASAGAAQVDAPAEPQVEGSTSQVRQGFESGS